MKKKIDYTKLSGQHLSDAAARMMGYKRIGNTTHISAHWEDPKTGCVTYCSQWKPHSGFSQCRIVEEWIYEKGLWYEFSEWHLYNLAYEVGLRSTCEDRLRAALAAWEESK